MSLKFGLAVLLISIPSFGSDVAAGLKAFKSGDYSAAYKEWKPLADKGDANAQCNLGILYSKGLGVQKDPAEAFRLFNLAAVQGNTQAEFQLGVMYAKGYGVAQNYGAALMWTQKAAEAGDPDGENRLGWLYDEGYGVPKDVRQAAYYYKLAADKGNPDAAFNLARWLVHDDPVAEVQRRGRISVDGHLPVRVAGFQIAPNRNVQAWSNCIKSSRGCGDIEEGIGERQRTVEESVCGHDTQIRRSGCPGET